MSSAGISLGFTVASNRDSSLGAHFILGPQPRLIDSVQH